MALLDHHLHDLLSSWQGVGPSPSQRLAKRLFDLCLAVALLVPLLPVILLTAWAARLDTASCFHP